VNVFTKSTLMVGLCFASVAQAQSGPKNVILMVGDGMGFSQVEAGSIYTYGGPKGQPYWSFQPLAMSTYSETTGEAYDPIKAWETFEYHLDKPTDSAAAATTLSTGVKTINYRVGMTTDEQPLRHLVEDAESMGKATGVLTTVYFTHATPASFSVHVPTRKDKMIAQKMIGETALDLIIGAGHPWFDDDSKKMEEASYGKVGGKEYWESIEAGKIGGDANGDGKADPWTLKTDLVDFDKIAPADLPQRLLGVLPVTTTLQFNRGGDTKAEAYAVPKTEGLPDMATLMRGALNFLGRDEDGFFLMAEGGAIDWAGHDNLEGRLVEEQRDFDDAIAATVAWVEANSSWDDTLLIITADHETGYLYGPGSKPTWKALKNNGKGNTPGAQWHTGGHTNQLVPFFAKGNGAEEFLKEIKGEDPRRGKFIDNADVAPVIRRVWK
jgi:alkaline phosphatase